jgi:tRNA dimethylallyltransferase
VYRTMDIGTAKPSLSDQARVTHHLIDCVDPWDAYSAARFASDAHAAIMQIRQRQRIPLLVGGTMLYAKALMQGLDELPSADSGIRHRLDNEAKSLGWPALHARLAGLDPVTAARLASQDSQRISRALEIIELTGRPMSELLSAGVQQRSRSSNPAIGKTIGKANNQTIDQTLSIAEHGTLSERPHASSRFDWRVLALEPSNRSLLHERIAQRFGRMLEQGFVAEVERLRADPRIHAELPAMRCVGYRQIWDMLDGNLAMKELNERAVAATRQLAKRQLTWLRAMPQRISIDCTDPNGEGRLIDQVARELEGCRG